MKTLGLTGMSISTTLVAAYIKKRDFVNRIKALADMIKSIEHLLSDLQYEYDLPPCKREKYYTFINSKKTQIQNINSAKLMTPGETSETRISAASAF